MSLNALNQVSAQWNSLSRGRRRFIIAMAIMLDSSLGLLYGFGILNGLDSVIGGRMPNDMVWLLQAVESISGGFFFIKILFDDVKRSTPRTIGIILSPIFLLFIVGMTIEFLLIGLDIGATITLDLISIGVGTLTWSSTYLAIAVGLTLTYKVQRYGNFAQSEFFMIGMYLAMVMVWSDYFFPLYDAPRDGTLVWSVLLWTIVLAFFLTGVAGIIVDRLVYKGFRDSKAKPEIMLISSLGVALVLRAIIYLRFGSSRKIFEPDADWRTPSFRWDIPTQKFRFIFGNRSLDEGQIYNSGNCQAVVDSTTGETVMEHIPVTGSKPMFEMYDVANDCVTHATTGYAYYKAAMPILVFATVITLIILLRKTRLGRRMRAVSDNPELAASSGINVERIQLTSAFLSAGVSGMGGAIFAMTLRFTPETAFTILLPSFAIIILGTLGSIPGAVIGSLIVGFVRALSSPILIGVGMPLDRSNYTALDGVMPYVFLIAILMIMPEGIGSAYEKWKVDRMRRQAKSTKKSNPKISALLAFSPLGIFGAHQFHQKKSARGESMLILSVAALFFSRIINFIKEHSFARNSCSNACETNAVVDTNLEFLTGRGDGTIILDDAPFDLTDIPDPPSDLAPYLHEEWAANALSDLNTGWLNLMQSELGVLESLITFGDIIWPAVPILLWLLAIVEGVFLIQGKEEDPLKPIFVQLNIFSMKINEAVKSNSSNLPQLLSKINSPIREIQSGVFDKISTRTSDLDTKQKMIPLVLFSLIILSKLPYFFSRGVFIIGMFWVAVFAYLKYKEGGSLLEIYQKKAPFGRESPFGSWMMFFSVLIILLLFLEWLPVAEQDNMRFIKTLQVSNVLVTLAIFALMAFSLNFHTGITGMVNFGVIFFVGIGAITVGILTAPSDSHGYGWPVLPATLVGIALAGGFGWLLAYPTARLRIDYFAIVTISIGEILRVLLMGEPLLRAGSWGSSIGISRYALPMEGWWFCGRNTPMKDPLVGPDAILGTADDIINPFSPDECRDSVEIESIADTFGNLLELGEPAPYMMLLAIIGIISMLFVWWLLEVLLRSPWGRILRSIREDEAVSQHHGHDVLTHKAASLALGGAIAGFAGALWAWKLTGFQPSFMSPARSTFLVWGAFIIGGAANNRGMVIGAFIIVLMQFVFNVLVAGQGSSTLPLHTTAGQIDSLVSWVVLESWQVVNIGLGLLIIGYILGSKKLIDYGAIIAFTFTFAGIFLGPVSVSESFLYGEISADMAFVKVLLVGCLIILSLKFNAKGILPEVPHRPPRVESNPGGEN